MAEHHHQAGQKARGGREADQGLEEHRHGATPNEQALNKGRTAAGAKAKVDARLLPALCFEVIAPARFECFRLRLPMTSPMEQSRRLCRELIRQDQPGWGQRR